MALWVLSHTCDSDVSPGGTPAASVLVCWKGNVSDSVSMSKGLGLAQAQAKDPSTIPLSGLSLSGTALWTCDFLKQLSNDRRTDED